MPKSISAGPTQLTASIGLVIGGAMWGVYWIPVRVIADMGLPGVWAGVVLYLAALIVLLPIIWINRKSLLSKWQTLLFVGFLTGSGGPGKSRVINALQAYAIFFLHTIKSYL